MPNIIVSYRRSDSDVIAGRIRDRLASHYGADSVFMDIDSIPFGLDFREHIRTALLKNDILLAVIGPKWVGGGSNPRIMHETDPVRIEIEAALQRGIPLIPVLVAGAAMPATSELPDGLKDLAFRNAATVDGGRDFHQHMDRLIRSMDRLLPTDKLRPAEQEARVDLASPANVEAKREPRVLRWAFIGVAIALLGVSGGLAYVLTRGAAPSEHALQQAARPVQQQQQQTSSTVTDSLSASPTFPAAAPPCTRASSANAFYDNFKTQDIGWQPPIGFVYPDGDKPTSINGDHLEITAKEKMSFMEVYSSLVFSDVNVCVRVMNPRAEVKDKSQLNAGITFWFQGFGNAYAASMFLSPPSIQLFRNINRSWLNMGTSNAPQLKTEPSGINQIQIVTKGNFGAEYVNGAKVGEFKGQPPVKAPAGIVGQSESQQKNTWTFLDFSVSEY